MIDGEHLLLEAVKNYLRQDAKLGLAYHKPSHEERESSHRLQYQWESINDAYELAVLESRFADSLNAAFYKVHSYKYVNDPTFKLAMDSELRSMGIPNEDRELAQKAHDKVIKEMLGECGERDAGWNPQMDQIVDVTSNADNRKPQRVPPFTGGGPAPQPATQRGGEPHAVI
jgi:hypothetical protein